jgi:hypothetical protein
VVTNDALTLGYAHFFPGAFTRHTGRDDDTDFFCVETTARAFKYAVLWLAGVV